MEILNHKIDLGKILSDVASSDQPVLLLDYDGTLAPFRDERDQAYPYPEVRESLARIIAGGRARLAVISGRSIDDLIPLLGLDPPPEIFGSHGLEHLTGGGSRYMSPLSETTQRGLAEIRGWVKQEGLDSVSELKPSGAAFHWRGLPDAQARRIESLVRYPWQELAGDLGLELHRFDGGLELRVAGITKGNAVKELLDTVEPGQPVAYFGDDRTDEDAFRALKGRGLTVLVRTAIRDTVADIWIAPPDELVEFLSHWE
jgi:trehalose 6-phosphate phosphatase